MCFKSVIVLCFLYIAGMLIIKADLAIRWTVLPVVPSCNLYFKRLYLLLVPPKIFFFKLVIKNVIHLFHCFSRVFSITADDELWQRSGLK